MRALVGMHNLPKYILANFPHLTIKGSKLVTELIEKLELSCNVDDHDRLCPVCYCVPDFSDKYVYEMCGHPVCKSCLGEQLRSGELPLKCNREVRDT